MLWAAVPSLYEEDLHMILGFFSLFSHFFLLIPVILIREG